MSINSEQLSIFDKVYDRHNTWSTKWDKYRGRDIYPMWLADMDFRAPHSIITAVQEQVKHGIWGYSSPPEILKTTIISYLRQRHSWSVHPDWFVWLPGVVPGLHMATNAICQPDQHMLMPVPIYYHFLHVPENTNRKAIHLPLIKDRDLWVMDFDALAEMLVKTKLSPGIFMLCNPHNPTGRSYTKKELTTLAEILIKHNIAICSDEIHCDLLLNKNRTHIPIASLGNEIADQSITFMAPTKTFNMPGLNFAFAIVPNARLRSTFEKASNGMNSGLSPFSLAAALAAYQDGWNWHQQLLLYLRDNEELVYSFVNALEGVSCSRVEATYLAWIDVRKLKLENPVKHFEGYGIGLMESDVFGQHGFLRLNYGCPRKILEEALARFATGVSTANQ